jgi:hypothetical protein
VERSDTHRSSIASKADSLLEYSLLERTLSAIARVARSCGGFAKPVGVVPA